MIFQKQLQLLYSLDELCLWTAKVVVQLHIFGLLTDIFPVQIFVFHCFWFFLVLPDSGRSSWTKAAKKEVKLLYIYPTVLRKFFEFWNFTDWNPYIYLFEIFQWKFIMLQSLVLNCSYPIWRGKTVVWDLADIWKINSWNKPYTITIQTWQVAANKKDIWKILFEIDI